MSRKPFTIEALDYHRNGMVGAGFVVAIIYDAEEKRRFLVTDFSYNYASGKGEEWGTTDYGYTSVIDVDEAQRGNIFMHPAKDRPGTGGNAWRGDRLGDKYRPAIRKALEERWA